jgi:hypothetical protein
MPPVMDTGSCLTVLVLRGFDDGDIVRRRLTIRKGSIRTGTWERYDPHNTKVLLSNQPFSLDKKNHGKTVGFLLGVTDC